jgi:hypothetical protein
MNARKKLADKVNSSKRLKGTSLLNRASTEANNTQAAWSDFFDDMGKPCAKLPPEQELDRLDLANALLDELDYLHRDLPPEMPERTEMKFRHLRAEIGRAGEAPDIDRALAAVEDGIQHLRWEIGPYIREAFGMAPSLQYQSERAPASHYPRRTFSIFSIIVSILSLIAAALVASLFITGRLSITTLTGAIVVAGILVAIPLLSALGWAALKLAPYALSLLRYVYQQLWLPLVRNAILRLRGWRYALLRDFVTATVVVVLLVLGVTSVLVTTYAGREAFGKPLDYIALGLAATTVSIVAAVGGYLTNRFHKPASGSKK